MKTILEIKEDKKKEKEEKKKKRKEKKEINKKIKKVTKKIFVDSDSEESYNERDLCDDDEMDDMSDVSKTVDQCIICGEFGKSEEIWFRCTTCGLWTHKDCSGAETAKNYVCDLCQS